MNINSVTVKDKFVSKKHLNLTWKKYQKNFFQINNLFYQFYIKKKE